MPASGRHLAGILVPPAALATRVLESFDRTNAGNHGARVQIPPAPATLRPRQARGRLRRGTQACRLGPIAPSGPPLLGHPGEEQIARLAHKSHSVADDVDMVEEGISRLPGGAGDALVYNDGRTIRHVGEAVRTTVSGGGLYCCTSSQSRNSPCRFREPEPSEAAEEWWAARSVFYSRVGAELKETDTTLSIE